MVCFVFSLGAALTTYLNIPAGSDLGHVTGVERWPELGAQTTKEIGQSH